MPTPEQLLKKNIPTASLSGLDTTSFDPFRGDTFKLRAFDAVSMTLEGDNPTRKTDIEREINGICDGFAREAFVGTRITDATSGKNRFWLPYQAVTRDSNLPSVTLSDNVGADGGYLVEQPHVSQGLTDALRPASACVAAGATIIPNQSGNFAMPYLSSDFSPSGASETWQVTSDWGTELFARATASPVRIAAPLIMSKALLLQSATRDIQRILVNSAMRSIGSKLDFYMLSNGGVVNGQTIPVGITSLSQNSSGQYNGTLLSAGQTFSGAATYPKLVAQRQTLLSANVPTPLAWIIDPSTYGRWAQIQKAASYPVYLLDTERNTVLGDRCIVSQNLASTHQAVIGHFEDWAIVLWGPGFLVTTDIYSLAASGLVKIIIEAFVGWCPLRPLSFSASTDSAAQ